MVMVGVQVRSGEGLGALEEENTQDNGCMRACPSSLYAAAFSYAQVRRATRATRRITTKRKGERRPSRPREGRKGSIIQGERRERRLSSKEKGVNHSHSVSLALALALDAVSAQCAHRRSSSFSQRQRQRPAHNALSSPAQETEASDGGPGSVSRHAWWIHDTYIVTSTRYEHG